MTIDTYVRDRFYGVQKENKNTPGFYGRHEKRRRGEAILVITAMIEARRGLVKGIF